VGAMSRTPFGGPASLANGCLNAAADLVAGGGERQAAAGWVLLRSLLCLPPEWYELILY